MANAQAKQIRNKGIYNNVSLDVERTETFGVSKWSLFKTLFFGRFGTVVLANLLAMIFAIPGIIVMVLFYVNSSLAVGLVPYSGNIGFGLAVAIDPETVGAATAFNYLVYECLILIPCIAVFALGVVGDMYVMNKLATGEQVHLFKDFFRGIKRGGLSSVILGFIIGIVLVGVVLSLDFFDVYDLHVAYKIVSLIASIVLLVFLALFTAFFMTQTVTAKMPVGKRIHNALLFMIGTNVQAILFVGIAVAPAFLILIPGILMLFVMLYVLLGVSYTTLVIALYCRNCYETYTIGKVEEVKQTSYAKREEQKPIAKPDEPDVESADKPAKKKPSQRVQYKNPKKRKRTEDSADARGGATSDNDDADNNLDAEHPSAPDDNGEK